MIVEIRTYREMPSDSTISECKYTAMPTIVCTMYILLVLISLTNSKMLRSSFSFSLSIIASRVMKVPVRPTPALNGVDVHYRSTHNVQHTITIIVLHA